MTNAQYTLLAHCFFVAGFAHSAPLAQQYAAGLSTVGETLLPLADSQGWSAEGAGCCHPGDDSPWAEHIIGTSATALSWAGNRDGVMIHARGANWRLGNLTLLGWNGKAHRNELKKRPGCRAGIWVQQSGRFTGTKAEVSNVGLAGFDSALLIGRKGEGGNDNLSGRKLTMQFCGSAIEIVSQQAMGTRLTDMHVFWCDQVVLASGGGDVAIRNLLVDSRGTLLRVTAGGKRVGPNNGSFSFETIKVDNSGRDKTFTLCDLTKNDYVRCTVRDLRLPTAHNDLKLRARINGKSRLLVEDAKNMPVDTRFHLSGGGAVVLRDCDLGCEPQAMLEHSTAGHLVVRDCWHKGRLVNGEWTPSRKPKSKAVEKESHAPGRADS